MPRSRLLHAVAALALMAAPALAQDMPAQTPVTPLPAETATTPRATTDTRATTPAPAAAPAAPAGSTVIDALRSEGQFTTLMTALDAAQLTETLNRQPAVSIFAPTDAAFAALPEAERARLLNPANVNELRQLLLYHVIVADVHSDQIKGTKGGVETAARTAVQLDGTGASIKVDAATVTTADIEASNGAVFAIDRVLNPAARAATPPATAPAPTPPVAPSDPADDPTSDMPDSPVTPPTPQA